MRIVAGPAAIRCGTLSVAVSVFSSRRTVAGWVLPPASIATSPKAISAACSVTALAGASSRTRISARPRKVSRSRSGANHSV